MTPIYHITHLHNLPQILTADGLLAVVGLRRDSIGYTDIAHQGIQDRRATTQVPLPPFGVVHDYVPFYFAPRSPMLYAISRGNVSTYSEGQDAILYLVTSAQAVSANGLLFVFTDGHAIMAFSEFFNDMERLNVIDWELMRARYWADTQEDGDRVRRRNAEFLVHRRVPWNLIHEIGVINQDIRDEVRLLLTGQSHQPQIVVRRQWYY